MTAPDDAIRARRRLTNKLIAAHEAERLRPFFAADVTVIVGGGGVLTGMAAVIDAFAGQFRDPAFVTYVRTPERVEIGSTGDHAAETGRWVATWTSAEITGAYLAAWRKVTGQWVIENEMFVTLGGPAAEH